MDQYCIIDKILWFLSDCDYLLCLYINKQWYDVTRYRINAWDNWTKNSVLIEHIVQQNKISFFGTDFDQTLSICFCSDRGLFFRLVCDHTRLTVKIRSILNWKTTLYVHLKDPRNRMIDSDEVEYHKVFDCYFLKIGKILIDCTNLHQLQVHKGEKDNVWTLSQVFFHLKSTRVPRLSFMDQTYPFQINDDFFDHCLERKVHLSIETPKVYHYVVYHWDCERTRTFVFSFDGVKLLRKIDFVLRSLSQLIQVNEYSDEIIVSDRHLVILDEDSQPHPLLIIYDVMKKFLIVHSLAPSANELIELCPLPNNKFLVLFLKKNQLSNYTIFHIGEKLHVTQSGMLNFVKPSKNIQDFKDFTRFDQKTNKLIYVNKSEICEIIVKE